MSTNGKPRPAPGPGRLLRLVQICDSALPVGAYSHSWGLEAAIDRRQVRRPEDLERWARAWLSESVAPADGLLAVQSARLAHAQDWPSLADLNDLLAANKVSPTLRKASLNTGEALLALASGWPWSGRTAAEIRASGAGPWHHAIVFGALADSAGAETVEALSLYLQNAAAGLIASAVRAVPLGHTHGQQVLARLQPLMLELADRWASAPLECFGGLSPAYEVLGYAQSQLYTRIFQS
jgi:urease accessory protein